MIVGRKYILQSLRNNKALRPASNTLSAVLEAYDRPVSGIDNFLFELQASGSEFLFKHVVTGYYLTADGDAPGAGIILAALVGGGNSFQRWTIQGNDPSTRISPVSSLGDKQMTLISDSDGDDVTTQPYGGASSDELVSFNEYSAAPSGLVAPVLSRIFKNFTTCTVSGIAEGASVKVFIDDVEKASASNISGGSITVLLGTLQIGQKISVEQTLNTIASLRSTYEYVQENAKVWEEGQVGALQYRAYKTVVTSVPDANNVETIAGPKGEPIGPYRVTYDAAFTDMFAAGFTETQYNSTSVTPPQTTDSITTEQKNALDNWMNANKGSYSGNVQNVLYRSGEIYRFVAGYKSITEPSGIASLSKWFFGAVAAKAVQDGMIGWNDTLGSKVSIFNSVGKGNPTFIQLMCHMGGWPESSAAWASGNSFENRTGDTLEQCAENIAQYVPLSFSPGSTFQYSGIGMQLAGRMLEAVYSLPIQTIINNLLLSPLGMTQTTYTQPGIGGPTANPQLAAGLWSTVDDFGKFMTMLLNRDGTVLNSASTNLMESDQTGIGAGYGIGVWTNGPSGQPYHQGASGCEAWLNRGKGIWGLIFTYNSNPLQANPANSSFVELVRSVL